MLSASTPILFSSILPLLPFPGRGVARLLVARLRELEANRRIVDVLAGVRAPADLQFTLRPERWYDRFAKLLTLSAEYQVGDDAFDRAVYVVSDSETVCGVLLCDARLRTPLLDLFRAQRPKFRVTHAHVNSGKLWVRMKPTVQSAVDEDAVHEIATLAPALRAIESRIRAVLKGRPIDRDRSFLHAAFFAAISVGFAVSGAVAVIVFLFSQRWAAHLLDHRALLLHAAITAGVVIGALAIGSRVLLGHTSRGHLVLFELLTFGLLGAFATAWIELRQLNLEFDRSRPVTVSTQVLGKHESTRRKGGVIYSITLRDWTGGDEARSFEVLRPTYQRIGQGQTIHLDEHRGLLGYRWIDNLRPE